MFWGLTPALDLQEELKLNGSNLTEINVLIVGGADARHVLKTLARRYRHEKVKINFYLVEAIMEVVAKQILLLNVALQQERELGVVQKTRYFMELYGNSIVRPAVERYLKTRAHELVKMVTNEDYMAEIMPFMKLQLKYKERDYLEKVFKFWCSGDDFDVLDSWDRRMRRLLGVRYDCKKNVFEWDLHMRLHSVGGLQVCSQEYTKWRETGIAYTWLESEVSKPNRSFVCGLMSSGDRFIHGGYLGDMQTGPFVTYGLDCEDPSFLKKSNGVNAQRATDVTERNLRQLFHEITTNEEYIHKKINDINMGSATFIKTDLNVVDFGGSGDLVRKSSTKCVDLGDCTINYLNVHVLKSFSYKEEFRDFFNLIYFGSTYLRYLEGPTIELIAASKSLLIIENQIFVLSYRDKDLEEFCKTMKDSVDKINSLIEIPFDVKKDTYARFILKGEKVE